jgi:hypothetical protein
MDCQQRGCSTETEDAIFAGDRAVVLHVYRKMREADIVSRATAAAQVPGIVARSTGAPSAPVVTEFTPAGDCL